MESVNPQNLQLGSLDQPVDHAKVDAVADMGVTKRVVVLSLGLAALFGYLIPILDYKLFNTFLGATHLPPGAIAAMLVLLLVVNPLLAISKKLAMRRNEVLTIYITCLFSCLIPGHGGENFVIPNLLAPFYFATPENKWLESLLHLKPWMTPALNADGTYNSRLVQDWYSGIGSQPIPWAAWLVPLLFWGALALVSYFMLGCLSVMLRAQWTEKEALSFPLLRLPVDLTEGMDESPHTLPSFFRQRLMWIGFGIAVFIQLLNGLNTYFPDVPPIVLDLPTAPYLAEAPWNQIGGLKVAIFPIVVGISFLLTSEVTFSLWFFLWFFKLQYVVAYYLGFTPTALPDASGAFPGKMFTGYQMGGAFLAYVGIVLWMAREHLQHVARRAFGREAAYPAEEGEVMSYPLAFWGFVVSFALMIAATCLAGVRLDIALVLWLSYLVFAIGLTRVAVEGGLLFLLHMAYPLGAVAKLLPGGTSWWMTSQNGAVSASIFQSGFIYHMRAFLMPSFVQSFKLAHDQKINGRRLGLLLVGVVMISLVVSWIQVVRVGYEVGGLQLGHTWFAQKGSISSIKFVTALTKGADASALTNWFWMGLGATLTYGMMLARARLLWFPFHPLGYLMGLTFPIGQFWFSIFLAWLLKTLINRFGGSGATRHAVPLFLGLALGDVSMMLFWLIVDGLTGTTGHQLMPG